LIQLPMGKQLHFVSGILYIFILSFLLMVIEDNKLVAQLKFENLQPFELEISEVSDLANQNYWRLNPADHELSRLFGVGELRNNEQNEGHYQLQRDDGYYLAYHAPASGDYELFRFRFENVSETLIDRVRIGLDLALQLSGTNQTELILYYTNGRETESERIFSDNQFRGEYGGWNRTSIGTQAENLLLSPGESIEFSIRVDQTVTQQLPDVIALQRVEITPERFQEPDPLNTADLVITEIFPGSVVDGEPLHYLELYNSTSESLNLRGLTIQAGGEDYRIREPLEIMPFEWVLIANRSVEYLDFNPDLLIQDLHLPSHGGMIELVQNEQRIMRAAYDEQQGARSWELESIYPVINGYASINDFRASEEQYSQEIAGTPGRKGITRRVFTLDEDNDRDWIMFSPPGNLQTDIDAGQGYWTGNISGNRNQIPAGAGVLARTEFGSLEDERKKWIAIEHNQDEEVVFEIPESDQSWLLLGNPYLNEMSLSQVIPQDGNFESVTAQVWDPVYNTFSLLEPGDRIKPWQAFIIKNRDAESVRYELNSSPGSRNDDYQAGRSRSIRFQLEYSETRQQPIYDHAAVLYFHDGIETGSSILNAEKLWPIFQDENSNRSSLIYFIGHENGQQINLSQSARPFQVDQPFEIQMGHVAYNVSGQHTLRWDSFENIPESWEILITDTFTGQTLDMREHNQLVFTASANLDRTPDFSDSPGLHPVELSNGHERFSVRVNPNPAFSALNDTDSTQPESIELYQNYPNPFNPATNIRFYLPEQQSVVVGVYNVVGQRVAQLLDDVMPQGEHTVVWDATEMPSGIYIIHLDIGNRVLTRKMTLIK
jgi:hypothetical protein